MDKNKYAVDPVIIKAKELAEAIKNCPSYKKKDDDEILRLIMDCNDIITKTIKLDYGAICKPPSGCCG